MNITLFKAPIALIPISILVARFFIVFMRGQDGRIDSFVSAKP
jgi:hypothetical protein